MLGTPASIPVLITFLIVMTKYLARNKEKDVLTWPRLWGDGSIMEGKA